MSEYATKNLTPVEVQLAWEVMTCRALRITYDTEEHACRWFNQHYGPYPAFDWLHTFSDEVLEEGVSRSRPAVCAGSRYQLPELMSGCRKAPIMTIGINPNLTAFWPDTKGATWAYPFFDDIGQFAHYFRYRSVFQERFQLDFVRDHVLPDSEIRATGSGTLKRAIRSKRDERLMLELSYDQAPDKTFDLDRDYEVFIDRGQCFRKDDLIAAKPDLPVGQETELIHETVGYYQRFRSILKRLKEMAGGPIQQADLRMGEDVCQADMVACASPGWGSWFSDEAREGIIRECVHKRGWVAQQLLQTCPAVVVFAGLSAYRMFHQRFDLRIHPQLEPDGDTFELLAACANGNYRLKAETPSGTIDARILISPHFSYEENFEPQCRFDREQWQQFERTYPHQAELLKPVTTQNFDKSRFLVFVERPNSPTPDQLGESAWNTLMGYRFDAIELLAQGLSGEYAEGRIGFDPQTEHLMRTQGACEFCDNALYRLPEGCIYNVEKKILTPQILRNDAFSLLRK